jgi:hypothetical protein
MQNQLYTQTKHTQTLSSTLSHTPSQGMFESRSSVVQQKQQEKSQQPNLQNSLMQAERYGHHLQHTHQNQQDKKQELPIQKKTLVIGGPAKEITLKDIAKDKINGKKNPSHDGYIGNAYAHVTRQEDEAFDKANRLTGLDDRARTNTEYHTNNPPLRIPDKFGDYGVSSYNLLKKIRRRWFGSAKRGPRRSYKPEGDQKSYLSNLNGETLHIVAHGSTTGLIGGYTPEKLAKLLVNMGLEKGEAGEIHLRACLSARPGKNKPSPIVQLEDELKKLGINMTVKGFVHEILATQTDERLEDKSELVANLIGTSDERARLGVGQAPINVGQAPTNNQPTPQTAPTNNQPTPQTAPTNNQPTPQTAPTNNQPTPQTAPTNNQPTPQTVPTNNQPTPQTVPTNNQPIPQTTLPLNPEISNWLSMTESLRTPS